MNPQRRLFLSGLLAAGPMLAFAHPSGNDPASFVTQKLAVGGRVKQALDLSPEALREFPVQTPEITIRGRKGETQRTLKGYSGAKLTDILDKSGLPDEHNDLKTRVGGVESKLDRITWLIIATLAASLADLLVKVKP